ncbi:hypothetical protein [Psychrobacter pocilloporae]|uniref:Uncharacterized protein n=1 Tax=Psychrobacter pocilloporae TaxID=1775882 RepID=A0ABT6IVJ8_9GAMM|nr:hypothetical protein [Psychrobacter pocilloporae]MDH4905850.1 hypothetical protein [Psychrobacter pocilloporae]MEC9444359.1 hypothetical protein [Pseudomonadota bacterium]MED6318224.1 hypothetical protein [Pseudomonadota bacterium]
MSRATLASLDMSLYPLVWEQQTFIDSQQFLIAILTQSAEIKPEDFTKLLLNNPVYQEWINATVFGRYIQRSFAAFYQQTEDSFNMDMPALFRNELTRHAQYMPLGQVLFFAGEMSKVVRQTKLLTTTVNPATAIINAQKMTTHQVSHSKVIVNQITIVSKQVLGFPIRHNKRTSERLRNEVLIMDFQDLRLVNEVTIEDIKKSNIESSILLRSYELR